ncbi:MAG: hypothetical protein R3F49_04590 [Planctomycetota bacterium]
MKRFLYGPILAVVEARDDRIAAELADAKEKQDEAQQARAAFQEKNAKLDGERAALLQEAKEGAAAERKRLLDAARDAADALGEERRKALDLAADNLEESIAERAQMEVFAIAKKELVDLASASLEQQAVEVFIRRLRALWTHTRRPR